MTLAQLYSPNQRQQMFAEVDQYQDGQYIGLGYPNVYGLYRLTTHKDKVNGLVKQWSEQGSVYNWPKRVLS